MKIDNSIKPVPGVTPAESTTRFTPGAAQGAGAQRSQRASEGAASAFSSELQAVEHGLATSGVVDQGRVDAIKQAISEGRLKINPEAIADKLIESARELIEHSKTRS